MRSPYPLLLILMFAAAFPLAAQESVASDAAASGDAALTAAVPAIDVPASDEAAAVEASPGEEAAAEPAAEPAVEEASTAEEAAADEAVTEAATDEEASAADEAVSDAEAATEAEVAQAAAMEELNAEVEQLGAELEQANAIIDELRAEAWDLKQKAAAAEALAQAERDAAQAAENERAAAELGSGDELLRAREEAEAAAALRDQAEAKVAELEGRAEASEKEAAALKARIAELEARIAALETIREAKAATLSTWGGLRLSAASYPEVLMSGFGGASKQRLGSWKIAEGVASQTDDAQFFSRLTFPLVQSAKPTLYSFDVKAGPKGWVGMGLHFFAEGVKKPKGYGEGKSLLVWLTRDAKMRGDNETYLQVYRSDDDVNMERVLDAEIQESVAAWNHLDILYEPGAEFVVIAVNGSVRTAYRTFFGIGSGVSVSLRTLGAGVSFRNFEVRR